MNANAKVRAILLSCVLPGSAPCLLAVSGASAQTEEPPPIIARTLLHMEDVVPTGAVRRGDRSMRLPEGDPLDGTLGIDLEAFNLANRSTGMIVVHRGAIVYEGYWRGASPESHLTSASMAKSFTSTLIGVALGEGRIDSLDDPIVEYVPELAESAYRDVTIEQGLQMSSGVRFDDYDSTNELMAAARAGDANAFLLTLDEKVAPPGTRFNYSTGETQVLGWVLRRAVGMPINEYLSEKIWQPLGMEDDASWVVDKPEGVVMAGFGLNARLRDYARFGMLMLNDGKQGGRQILPEGWVARATTPSAAHLMPDEMLPGNPVGYGYQWWTFPHDIYAAQGSYGQFIVVVPPQELVIVLTSAWPTDWDDTRAYLFHDMIDAIVRRLETADARE